MGQPKVMCGLVVNDFKANCECFRRIGRFGRDILENWRPKDGKCSTDAKSNS